MDPLASHAWHNRPMREEWTVDLLLAGTFYSSTSTLLTNRSHKILIDTGLSVQENELLAALRARGLDLADIDIIINTHLHVDHCSNNALFPRARIFLSQAEWRWTHALYQTLLESPAPDRVLPRFYPEIQSYDLPSRRIRKVISLVRRLWDPGRLGTEERFRWLENDALPAGLEILPTPGHTPYHISVRIGSPPIIVAGDAVLNHSNEEQVATMVPYSKGQYLATRAALLRFEGEIIPGHGSPFTLKKRRSALR